MILESERKGRAITDTDTDRDGNGKWEMGNVPLAFVVALALALALALLLLQPVLPFFLILIDWNLKLPPSNFMCSFLSALPSSFLESL
jgi:ABC-type transport system involved in cytochrome bd biosynthesis fused ATPase/permease subunit